MIILDYSKKNHKEIIKVCVHALRAGKILVYPTDTSYGLACDITNPKALAKFYKIKERSFKKPVHVIAPSLGFAKRITEWDKRAQTLAQKFWPGPLTLVLKIKAEDKHLKLLSAGTGFLGLRMPNNIIAWELAQAFRKPLPATSANPSGEKSSGYDSYSLKDILKQFADKKYKPDIIINAGTLPRRKPSTLVKIDGDKIEILRPGPISKKQILKVVSSQ
jgi:L-threonylcarbamoyladenylate synthase